MKSHRKTSSRRLRTLAVAALIPMALASCTTAEIERLKLENEQKRSHLEDLHEQFDLLDDLLVAQMSIIEMSRDGLAEARRNNQLSRKDRVSAERELRQQEFTVKAIQSDIAEKKSKAADLALIPVENEGVLERRREIAGDIADLREQMEALTESVERHTEARIAKYRRKP